MANTSRQTEFRWVQWLLVAIGALLVIGSIFADALGITWGGDGYGWKQLLATIVGLVIALAGIGLLTRPYVSRRQAADIRRES